MLFDAGASHSFVSNIFATENKLLLVSLANPLFVNSPGAKTRTSKISLENKILIGIHLFLASLILLGNSDIDVILGMDWLKANKAKIDCAEQSIVLSHPSGQIVYSPKTPASTIFYNLEAKSLPSIEDVTMVCYFPDIFPEELPGMPPDIAVEFVIELELGTAPISKRPYKIAPPELKLLKEQIDIY